MSEHMNEVRGEILINNLKTKSKWKFPLTGINFHKYQNKLRKMWKEKKRKRSQKGEEERTKN